MELPLKLRRDILKPYNSKQSELFIKFLGGLEVFFPAIRIESQMRYTGIYNRRRIVSYIEPQKYGIKLGFFRYYITPHFDLKSGLFESFPDWNTSKGGLVGFMLSGDEATFTDRLAHAGRLLFYSIEKQEYRLT